MEFLTSLDPVQWIFVAIGAFVIFQPFVTKFLEERMSPEQEDVDNEEKDDIIDDERPYAPDMIDPNEYDLTAVVCKWECLADACLELDLNEAYEKLEEVFPLLIKVRRDDLSTF